MDTEYLDKHIHGHEVTTNYRRIPPLAGYINRIGAEEKNFRSYLVTEYRGNYYYERVLIKIGLDGEIWVSNKDYAPTKEEAEAIKVALKEISFPKSIAVRDTSELRAMLVERYGEEPRYWEFYDVERKQVLMVQQRIRLPSGAKHYPSWTFWSDGIWRMMEPDNTTGLPFWKPKVRRSTTNSIMVHEGGKAAEFCDALVNEPELAKKLADEYGHSLYDIKHHPWMDKLRQYEHWGLIGGALAPHRADYSELKREKPNELIYVADNDFSGKDVITSVSRLYGRTMKALMFDEGIFPGSFDMADPMPKDLFKDGRWIGRLMEDYIHPATMATEMVGGEKGKSSARLTKDFRQEWFHCVSPEAFVHKDFPDRVLGMEEFNNEVRPYSHVVNTAGLVKGDHVSKTATLKYDPTMPSGIYSDGHGSFINTHRPSTILPEKGDPTPFINFMNHLILDDAERHEVLKWVFTLIARPATKILYGLLMISETQGIGKSTLGEKILRPILGPKNVSTPNESEIVDSQYNYWSAHKRLAIVHEIYAGHSSKAYDKLKTIITDDNISVNKKYQASYDVANWIHVYACSNSMRALYLPNDDRRWYVPKVTEKKQPSKYWSEFNLWLKEKGGLNIIRWYADEWIEEHGGVHQGDPAPDSKLKKEIVEEGLSTGLRIVAQTLDTIKETLESTSEDDMKRVKDWRERGWVSDLGAFVLDTTLVDLIKAELYDGRHSDRLERPGTVRKIAKARGWFIGEARANVKDWNTTRAAIGGRMIATTQDLANQLPSSLCNEKMKPEEKLKPIDVGFVRGI